MSTPAFTDEPIIAFGGAVKSLGEGRIGGWLVLFSTAQDPDLTRQFFTKSTDFWSPEEGTRPVMYYHGFDETLGKRRIGTLKAKILDAGIWAEAQLNLADAYEQKIEDLVRQGKLGWSSGSAPHMVSVKPSRIKGVEEITSWPIVEGTLTPMPAEPRAGVMSLKSFLKTMTEDTTDEDPEMKSADDNDKAVPFKAGDHVKCMGKSCGTCKSIHKTGKHTLYNDEEHEATEDAPVAKVDMHDEKCKPTGKVKCYKCSSMKMMDDDEKGASAKSEEDESEGDEETMSLKKSLGRLFLVLDEFRGEAQDAFSDIEAIASKSLTGEGTVNVPFSVQSEAVVSAVEGFVSRAAARLEARVKAGRELSEANRKEIEGACTALEEGVKKLRTILDRTGPKSKEIPEPAGGEKSVGADDSRLLQIRAALLGTEAFMIQHQGMDT